ncbi:GTP cyclohydrolase FolE2 [Stratiformator vulcanicus]|uniref:GTP cyclohydrolase FolE2 n=1 Tax=Stratiformator vulcanicus TaxID=2527980 RepID=A0A517R2W8_9PLAN|nr:GTP cyclohydrolase FolE2 [Stratiformator vulcanicus]QDT38218.1 GTP cyclohydrolase FolE2 [Stratiformator vulcanicus]
MSELISDALRLSGSAFQSPSTFASSVLPDIAEDSVAAVPGMLERVGMSAVEVLLQVPAANDTSLTLPGKADAFVSLDDESAKGIHMSRLFLGLQERLDCEHWTPDAMGGTLQIFLERHEKISRSASLAVQFELPVRRNALLTEHSGWRHYPVRSESFSTEGKTRHWLTVKLTYSSTCPCSAALSRQLIQQAFHEEFEGRSAVSVDEVSSYLGTQRAIRGLPHAQRSTAEVTVELDDSQSEYPTLELIDRLEDALKTPVQTAVKRADEQEFARLNADNLMFCEDAARILASELRTIDYVADFKVRVEHLESLHPHDAVAIITAGREGGLRP